MLSVCMFLWHETIRTGWLTVVPNLPLIPVISNNALLYISSTLVQGHSAMAVILHTPRPSWWCGIVECFPSISIDRRMSSNITFTDLREYILKRKIMECPYVIFTIEIIYKCKELRRPWHRCRAVGWLNVFHLLLVQYNKYSVIHNISVKGTMYAVRL